MMKINEKDQKAILKVIKNYFSESATEALARQTRFVQRSTSRLSGYSFLLMNMFEASQGKESSLNACCDFLSEEFGIAMTKQSLDERYNTDAVRFMRSCFELLLVRINPVLQNREQSSKWSCICVLDATTYKIPAHLAAFYKGHQFAGEALIKFHFNYDLLSGQVVDLAFGDGARSDYVYQREAAELFTKDGLYLRDLGYFDTNHFWRIDQAGAYFLSRSKSNQAYYRKMDDGKYKRICIEDCLPKDSQINDIEDVYVGAGKDKVKVRLYLEAVPEEVRIKRLARLNRAAVKQNRRKITDQRKQMCAYNIFITNADKQRLATDQIREVYSLRWQIELIFKIWKSVFKIDQVKKVSIFRFECSLYAQLISILTTLFIIHKNEASLWRDHQLEISPMIAARLLKKKFYALFQAIRKKGKQLIEWLDKFVTAMIKRAPKNRRKLRNKPIRPTPRMTIQALA